MPGFMLTIGTVMTCPHGVPATITPSQPRVTVLGQPVAPFTSVITVAGCPFTLPGPVPDPCVLVQWTMPSARVLVMGQPVALAAGPGPGPALCMGIIPNGPPIISVLQPRVMA